jgi:hypothetical protein
MVMESIQRVMDCVLLSRNPQIQKTSRELTSLLLIIGSVDYIKTLLRDHWARTGGNTRICLDIMSYRCVERSIVGSPVLLERWWLSHHIKRETEAAMDHQLLLKKSYKRLTVMLRTLYSLCLALPTFEV